MAESGKKERKKGAHASGSPRRASSPTKADRAWRQFEQLIARIERAPAPLGAIVTSPDHLPDCDTGKTREVDASIRYRVGSVDVLLVFECRDRGRRQGIEWLEQLATKKRAIGATTVVAVSSSGFGRRMTTKARALGLELREISKLGADELKLKAWAIDLAGGVKVEIRGFSAEIDWDRVEVCEMCLHFDSPDPSVQEELDALLLEALQSDPYDTPLLSQGDASASVTVRHVLAEFRRKNPRPPWVDLPAGTTGTHEVTVGLAEGLMVRAAGGLRPAKALSLTLGIHRGRDPIPFDYFAYSGGGGPLPRRLVAEGTWTAPARDQGVRFLLAQRESGGFAADVEVFTPTSPAPQD